MDEMAVREALRVQTQAEDNEFDGEQYEFVQHMIKTDASLPDFFKFYFYAYIGKDSVLSKLDSREIERIMLSFANDVNIFIQSMPTFEFTAKVALFLHQFKNLLRLRLHRSEGGFERKEISGTTQERHLVLKDDGVAPPAQKRRFF